MERAAVGLEGLIWHGHNVPAICQPVDRDPIECHESKGIGRVGQQKFKIGSFACEIWAAYLEIAGLVWIPEQGAQAIQFPDSSSEIVQWHFLVVHDEAA
jgi:hypothetical protein